MKVKTANREKFVKMLCNVPRETDGRLATNCLKILATDPGQQLVSKPTIVF